MFIIAVDERAHGEIPYLYASTMQRSGQEGELGMKGDALHEMSEV